MAEMPPCVVGEALRSAIDFPSAADIERLVVHQEHAAGRLALRVAQRGDVDTLRPAVDRVRARVAGLLGDFRGLQHADDFGLARGGLGVEDVDARRTQAGHDEITAFGMRMRRIRTQAGAAGVPAEMMQFVADVRHCHRADHLRVGWRSGIDVDHG